MMNRRRFVTVLAGSTVAPSAATLWGRSTLPASVSQSSRRSRVSLNGEWERYVDNVLLDGISVPSSQHPSGFYELRREFLLPRLSAGQRAVLHFDAITYYGEVSVNGKPLGGMGPYVPHEFEFTAQAKEGANQVEVGIADFTPAPDGGGKAALALGVNPGWEAYGGIIRDVYVELRRAVFIDNVRFRYDLDSGYSQAHCGTTIFVSAAQAGAARVEVRLEQGASEVARAETHFRVSAGVNEVKLQFDVPAPVLWSPQSPNLYDLKVRLESEGREDQWGTRTGFREVKIAGSQFLLNGEPLVLKGVCRHDMWKGEGFTLTAAQMEQDMRMIKELGCNFVRLVHYPHHRRIVELADEVGLLVSEEPGYWQVDFATMPRPMIELGYDIMERTIRRDWNSPSVFAWLLGNESKLTVAYLKEGKARCRKLDPLARPVSFANDMPMEQAKPIYEQAGMDFFDQHIYTYNLDDFTDAARFYGTGRPLTFTEWGGRAIGQSKIVMEHTVDRLIDLIETRALAGHCFWSWQDLRQYSRIDEEMHDGVLESGVVTESRDPRHVPYMELSRLYQGFRPAETPANTRPTLVPLRRIPWDRNSSFTSIDLQLLVDSTDGKQSWQGFEANMEAFWAKSRMAQDQWKRTGKTFLLWQDSALTIAGVPFRVAMMDGYARPLMLTPEAPQIVVPLEGQGSRLHVLGNVTMPEGFPVTGGGGEVVAQYAINYVSGDRDEIALRNGYEAARSNLICEATRINPEAINAQRAVLFVKDPAREHYQLLLLSHPLKSGRIRSVECRLRGKQPFAIFAMTLEAANTNA